MQSEPELTVDGALPGVVVEMTAPTALHDALRGTEGAAIPISVAGIAATIVMGCVALLMLGIQPIVLGGLQAAGRLSVPQMGQAATVETLALGVVSAGMAARVPHRGLRFWGLGSALLLLAANAMGVVTSGSGFVLSRALAGAAAGVIVWIAVGLITRRQDASRVNAIFLGAQALSQGAVAALAPMVLAPALGANSGLWVIAAGAALCLPLLLLIPGSLPELPAEIRRGAGLQISSLSGLASSLLLMGGIVGVWVYVEPIAHAIHIPERTISLSIAASLGAQVVGAMIIVAADRWVRPVAGLLATAAAFLAVTAAFAWPSSQAAFVVATVAFGLLWTAALALGMPLLIAADPTRRAPMYGPAATLLGSSLGPLAAGAFATDSNMKPALATAAVLFVLGAAATAVSAGTRPRPARSSS
ncbi:hypothetical protein ACO2Q3_01545 [Caulobacter sp. KR2-114]|uniref:hypothetical protein n=1 Tax=Caulobacter sp. KR2-114 TaxID=3400912 RepID=UPI003C0B20CB